MRLATKLNDWQAAGLIDEGTAAAILAHEDAQARPVALFAVAGLGLLALALGLFSLVAANWDDLSAHVKLGGHVVLIALAAIAAAVFARHDRPWMGEGALFLLGALTLAGIALQAQVYQQTGPLWQALGWCAVLVGPALLLLGRTRLTAYALAVLLASLAIAYRLDTSGTVGANLAMALAPALVFTAIAVPADARRTAFRDGLFEIGFMGALVAATIAQIAWVENLSVSAAGSNLITLPLATVVVLAVAQLAFRDRPRVEAELIAGALVAALAATVLALGVPHASGAGARFAGVLVYVVLWGGVAVLATRAGWHRLFRLAIAALALRLFVVYFELFYSLAFTGVGLMIGGVLLIALAWGWTRIVRRESL